MKKLQSGIGKGKFQRRSAGEKKFLAAESERSSNVHDTQSNLTASHS